MIFDIEIEFIMNIFWFRRDLRLDDNVGLFHALSSGEDVLPIFIFDDSILSQLPKDDARITFIHQQLSIIQFELEKKENHWLFFTENLLIFLPN